MTVHASPDQPFTLAGIRKDVLENHLTREAGHYFMVNSLIGLWGNGGMQQILLCEGDEWEYKEWELKRMVEAFRNYKANNIASFIEGLISKGSIWVQKIADLNRLEFHGETVEEAEFDKIWDEVNGYDHLFEKVLESEHDFDEYMRLDVMNHPEKYIIKREKKCN
jgi:hypothetical protein